MVSIMATNTNTLICIELNDFKSRYETGTIQFHITHLFPYDSMVKQCYLIDRCDPNRY